MVAALHLPVVMSDPVQLSRLCSFQGMTSPSFPRYQRAASLAGNALGKNSWTKELTGMLEPCNKSLWLRGDV